MLVGNAAEPETTSRMFDIACDGLKVFGNCGKTSSIFANIVGTPMKSVGSLRRALSAPSLLANLSQIFTGLKRINSTLAPDHIAQASLLITPCT
jgi:hypothetical protein